MTDTAKHLEDLRHLLSDFTALQWN